MAHQTEIKIWNPTMECMDREELRKIQGERLKQVVQRVYENVPVYRERMQKKGISPFDIQSVDDLKYLPFTDKTDLRDYRAHTRLQRHHRQAHCGRVYRPGCGDLV